MFRYKDISMQSLRVRAVLIVSSCRSAGAGNVLSSLLNLLPEPEVPEGFARPVSTVYCAVYFTITNLFAI